MLKVSHNDELRAYLKGKSVGFVPTMGALHRGHLSLVHESINRGLFTVVSIFVNPTQFNSHSDFQNYPKHLDKDVELLQMAGCDLVFVPGQNEIYPDDLDLAIYQHSFNPIDLVMEGKYRPGHFNGVGQVVHRLFELVRPQVAFFGEKDFQQLAVVRKLAGRIDGKPEIVGLPTMRETSGLAMSSRNERLTETQRDKAKLIYECLQYAAERIRTIPISDIKQVVINKFKQDPEWNLEYFEIVNPDTFATQDKYSGVKLRALIAAWLGNVRLIDNINLPGI